jgi:hypothetical protein
MSRREQAAGALAEVIDLPAELLAIAELAERAIDALADEHEGDLTRAVVDLHTRAAACLHLVSVW